MSRIFVLLDHYLPGCKSGGPARTVANLVERLSDRFQFWILTADRDLGDSTPYPGVTVDSWSEEGRARVYYASPAALLSFDLIRRLVQQVSPQIVYINSFFSALTVRFLLLRRLGLLPKTPVIIGPRGELSPGAMRLKATKKRLYRIIALRIGLYRGLIWHASATEEKHDILKALGSGCRVTVAPNLVSTSDWDACARVDKPTKVRGYLNLVHFSRVSPKKNLLGALELVRPLSGSVTLDIYGPIEDRVYWRKCSNLIDHLPTNVRAHYHGPIAHSEVINVLSQHHFLLLPTLSENFGHVVIEALLAGCPLLISDQTPWRDLSAKGIGWDLPLNGAQLWLEVLQRCVDMDEAEYRLMSERSRRFAVNWVTSIDQERQMVSLFDEAMKR